nr:protein rolling stone-like isoform X2 [Tanacetum cinerariifolium]
MVVPSDSTSLAYWMNLKFLLCIIWVFGSMIIASFLIWVYEVSQNSKTDKEATRIQRDWSSYYHEAWMPCVKAIHPAWLLAFRIVAFCLLLAACAANLIKVGTDLLYYYTQWTLNLVIVYFAVGSVLSAYGLFRQHRMSTVISLDVDAQQAIYEPINHIDLENALSQQEGRFLQSAAFWGNVFQILFQITAGASMLTDSVYWLVIVPFLSINEYPMSFLTVLAHSLNLIFLLGETAMNSLRFPWFRISYFIFLTAFFVIFNWIVHACVETWWPYPFLDLSMDYSPLWYLIVALLHLPCYYIFALIVNIKYRILARWFPESYQCLR